MLQFLVSAGHRNYVACLPHYLEGMQNQLETAPTVHAAFVDGKFTVHETRGKFYGVWSDMALWPYNKPTTRRPKPQNAKDKYLKALAF